jgi:hypothetical protein
MGETGGVGEAKSDGGQREGVAAFCYHIEHAYKTKGTFFSQSDRGRLFPRPIPSSSPTDPPSLLAHRMHALHGGATLSDLSTPAPRRSMHPPFALLGSWNGVLIDL